MTTRATEPTESTEGNKAKAPRKTRKARTISRMWPIGCGFDVGRNKRSALRRLYERVPKSHGIHGTHGPNNSGATTEHLPARIPGESTFSSSRGCASSSRPSGAMRCAYCALRDCSVLSLAPLICMESLSVDSVGSVALKKATWRTRLPVTSILFRAFRVFRGAFCSSSSLALFRTPGSRTDCSGTRPGWDGRICRRAGWCRAGPPSWRSPPWT